MELDAILIAGAEESSVSSTHPLRLQIEGRVASIQAILEYLEKKGATLQPARSEREMSWSSAYTFNGLYLYHYLARRGFQICLLNDFYREKEAFDALLRHHPRAIIISTTFLYGKSMLKSLVEEVKAAAPEAAVIVGGPFVAMSYELLRKKDGEPAYNTDAAKDDYLFLRYNSEPPADYYFTNRKGEKELCELLSFLKSGRAVPDIPGLATLQEGAYRFVPRDVEVRGEDESALDWDLLPAKVFASGVVPVQASYGCPYNCAFCNFCKDPRLFYNKPIDQLVLELRSLERKGVRYVRFVDDNFRLGGKDLKKLCRRLAKEQLSIEWICFIRASVLEEMEPRILKGAGCREVQIGIESADSRVLANMNKRSDPGMYRAVVRKLLSGGIHCSCYFIFGFPGETAESINKSIQFLKEMDDTETEGILSWSIYPFYLVPLSPVYEPAMREKYGLSGYLGKWRHHTMQSDEVLSHIQRAFMEISHSGPIYREDDLNLLHALDRTRRKEFMARRHQLAQLAVKKPIDYQVVRDAFRGLLRGLDASLRRL